MPIQDYAQNQSYRNLQEAGKTPNIKHKKVKKLKHKTYKRKNKRGKSRKNKKICL